MTIAGVAYAEGTYGGGGEGLAGLPINNAFSGVSSPTLKIRQIGPGGTSTTAIQWDSVGERTYETGIDRGVLYLNDGTVVPWNGLISVVENVNRESESVYYDGMKISTLISVGDYSATMKAFTYPDEFEEIQGMGKLTDGVFLDSQPMQSFALSYRTRLGDDLQGIEAGYKIHVLFNVVALPKDRTYETITDSPSFSDLEWDISAVQEEIPGHNPTAHIIINSKDLSSDFLEKVESVLYGDDFGFPLLPTLQNFIIFLQNLSQEIGTTILLIIDNGDGTWTATTDQDDLIVDNGDGTFEILNANATFDGDSYDISNTVAN